MGIAMEIRGLGLVERDQRRDYILRSAPIVLPVLMGAELRIQIEDYEDDPSREDFDAAIANFLHAGDDVLKAAQQHVFAYYSDVASEKQSEPDFVAIADSASVWQYVRFSAEPCFVRRAHGDRGVYVSVSCSCAWEPEHGLQIVFKEGRTVCKVGPFDGHLTNADAYDNDALEDVIYRHP